ncbi:uncharacterized protein LOC116844771 [Odontomachus brunneus]|uniref:uncharacterized protein LOC116844771 n=1 Tax=Odontomachus brunneus TaxID=486640 RepID=UPI0013F275E8|nr:uncharacterized protein LOC116844771 [Odontomachus brunneus]
MIAPNLMKTAPSIYSSNLDEQELEKRETQITNYVAAHDLTNIEMSFSESDIVNLEGNHDNMFYNNNKDDDISNKENVIPTIQIKKCIQMHHYNYQILQPLTPHRVPKIL